MSQTETKGRVLVAMSGGVDSSVAAALLVEQGYDVVGATMKLFCHGDEVPDRPCCSLDSISDARRVCQQLGVPHYGLNLEDRFGRVRGYPLGPGFCVDGRPVVLVRPKRAAPAAPARSASGSTYVAGARARVAREGRIYVEGKHDAELVDKVWGHDLRIEGVVVEPLHGVDDLPGIVREFRPASGRRLGVLVDHLVTGSKESRIAEAVMSGRAAGEHALVVGHPFIDIWQAVKPSVVGIRAWPTVPRGEDWKTGVCRRLGWEDDTGYVWAQRILARVRTWTDLEPALIGRVEELIDFVTTDS